ncbi:glycosyltransferase family 2 protein [Siphonobacter sp. SORGH_AS_0500]|uniref:glycosyltransferase family 2 protein n=1 Tax=Siphonobacter sp. SORGH_AS_0500 TaxID=1864824 RepID=UPI0028617C41|nr:glycosyltransferase family 2 protein [Siphonobacter sp. SORGH_AS_0500]MDR6197618.1 glycosyltransferase involved in cell wall biosynthesis [Siphonobacter sp. SORGH_AS_0500]
MSVPPTSLIVSTYNWPEALKFCLLSVARQRMLPDEVIIADDGSRQETRDLIEAMKGIIPVPLIHVWHEDLGFRKTEILNKAVRKSSGDYLIQIDGDVILHPYFIKDHIVAAEPGAFVRGTRARITPAKTAEILLRTHVNLHVFSKGVYNRLNALRLPVLKSLGERKEMKSRNVRGSNLAFWKADFIRVNGYNNDLKGWGHEDEELAARLINNSIVKKIIKLSAVQFHLHHDELQRPNEPFHVQVVEEVVSNNIKTCDNGYGRS